MNSRKVNQQEHQHHINDKRGNTRREKAQQFEYELTEAVRLWREDVYTVGEKREGVCEDPWQYNRKRCRAVNAENRRYPENPWQPERYMFRVGEDNSDKIVAAEWNYRRAYSESKIVHDFSVIVIKFLSPFFSFKSLEKSLYVNVLDFNDGSLRLIRQKICRHVYVFDIKILYTIYVIFSSGLKKIL